MSRQRAQGRRGRALCLALEGTQRAGLGERYASAAGHRLQARVGALTNAVAPSEAGRGGEPVPDYHSKMAREDAECRCGKSRFLAGSEYGGKVHVRSVERVPRSPGQVV